MRLSATSVEAWRRWQEKEEAEPQALIDYLLKKTEPTQAMQAGSAFHKLLEHWREDPLVIQEVDGFTFDFTELDAELFLPATREKKFTREIELDGQAHTVVCVLDAMTDDVLFDHKLTAVIDAERYVDSMQWRCYLDWMGYQNFTYNLFRGYASAATPMRYKVTDFTPVTFHAYPKLHEDVTEALRGLVGFVTTHAEPLQAFINR